MGEFVRQYMCCVMYTSADQSTQGPNLGRGGIDLVPSNDRSAPAPPSHIKTDGNPESLSYHIQSTSLSSTSSAIKSILPSPTTTSKKSNEEVLPHEEATTKSKLLPRETGHDIGMGSPVPLSSEAVGVITRLRNMKVSIS
jgi:tRNA pseudouridine32 synthase